MYIYTQNYLEPKDSVFLTTHIENYHLPRQMWVCGQQPHVYFVVLPAAVLKTWKCSSGHNVAHLQTLRLKYVCQRPQGA